MRALVLEQFGGPFIPKDVPTPAIAPHEALVRVRNVGVCGTDVKIRANRMGLGVIPLIMGHEIAGEVAEVGSEVRGFTPGDRVIVNFYVKQELQETMDLVARGRIKPIVDRIFPLAEIEEAFDALREGRSLGRNVLAI